MRTVLLIEDDAENREAVSKFFDRSEWKVVEAPDGAVGIDLALKHRPDVVVCDLLMPTNGFQVCQQLRRQLQPTRIIVLSARDFGTDRDLALESGADDYLLKPVTSDVLLASIARLLEEKPPRPRGQPIDADERPNRLKFWGVRGSIPVPGPTTVGYGGNTSCVEIRADGEIIILDAGSGIRLLGMALEDEFGPEAIRCSLLLTHTHWDHIQGLPFFRPVYSKKNLLRILGYEGARAGLGPILAGQMETPFFPVSLHDLSGSIAVEELKDTEFHVGTVRVCSKFANHPGICAGYRLFTSSGSVAYFPDHEPYEKLKLEHARDNGTDPEEARRFAADEHDRMAEFLRDCDLLILDTQYTDDEYEPHIGWGHGYLSASVQLAIDARVRELALFHHDPNHDDAQLDAIVAEAQDLARKAGSKLKIIGAREGAEIALARANTASART